MSVILRSSYDNAFQMKKRCRVVTIGEPYFGSELLASIKENGCRGTFGVIDADRLRCLQDMCRFFGSPNNRVDVRDVIMLE